MGGFGDDGAGREGTRRVMRVSWPSSIGGPLPVGEDGRDPGGLTQVQSHEAEFEHVSSRGLKLSK